MTPRALWFIAALGMGACGGTLEVEPQPAPSVRVIGTLDATPPGPVGTRDALFVKDGSFRHGWVAFCQARADTNGDGWIAAGDRFSPFLATGAGAGQAIDAYLGRDPSGRYAAFTRGNRLHVLDAATRQMLDVGPARESHVEVAFDHHGRMAYVRDTGYQRDLVLLDLATHAERAIRGTRGLVRSLAFSGQELGLYVDEKLIVAEVVEDTNDNGRLDLDAGASPTRDPCAVPATHRGCGLGDPRPDDAREVVVHLGAPTGRQRAEAVMVASWIHFDPCPPAPAPALATSSDGAALVALGGYMDAKERQLSRGPLEWRQPIRPTPSCEPPQEPPPVVGVPDAFR